MVNVLGLVFDASMVMVLVLVKRKTMTYYDTLGETHDLRRKRRMGRTPSERRPQRQIL